MKNILDNCVFVKSLNGVKSAAFTDKESDDILSIYKIENCFNLDKESTFDEIVTNLSKEMNCSPDGWLVFVSAECQDQIKEMIELEFLQAYKDDRLNFDNLDFSETILFHNVDSGTIIELIDPESGSYFFNELVEKIQEIYQEVLCFELCHMPSHVYELEYTDEGIKLLEILKNNNIQYYKG